MSSNAEVRENLSGVNNGGGSLNNFSIKYDSILTPWRPKMFDILLGGISTLLLHGEIWLPDGIILQFEASAIIFDWI